MSNVLVKNNQRQSNFELLRIVAMFMVLILHTEPPITDFKSSWELLVWNMFHYLCIIAVDLFVFISGYFGINCTPKSLVKFLTPPIFYTIVLGLLCGMHPFRIPPFFTSPWWFVNAYFLLMIFAPFINVTVSHISQKQHLLLFVVLGFVNIWQGFLQQQVGLVSGLTVTNLVFIYVFAQYYRKYGINLRILNPNNFRLIMLYLAMMTIAICIYVFCFNAKAYTMLGLVNYYNSPLVLFGAFIIFKCFENIHIQSSVINKVASSSFSVYLISNYVYFRETYYVSFWGKIYNITPPIALQ